ncbi:hypothetical protein BV375_08870 [Nostoc sp. 106C]|nr:hypothetical protein BV375_08870 [Nostoc sp. 106C]
MRVTSDRDRLGIASGLLSLSRTCGNTVGVSLIGAVFGGLIANVAAGADVSVSNAPFFNLNNVWELQHSTRLKIFH